MNPGYLTFISATCFVILALSGWRNQLCGELKGGTLALLLAVWAVSLTMEWRLTANLMMNAGAFTMLLLSGTAFRRAGVGKAFIHAAIAALLILIWHAFATHMIRLGAWLAAGPGVPIAAGEAAVAAAWLRTPSAQAAVLVWGITAAGLWDAAVGQSEGYVIGGFPFWDEWWPVYLFTRALSSALEWLGGGVKRTASRMK